MARNRIDRGLVLVGVKLLPETHAQLQAFADQLTLSTPGEVGRKLHRFTLGEVGRKLIEEALAGPEAQAVANDLESKGYQDGLRAGARAVRLALTDLFRDEE